jgi:hypothetical protein
VGKEKGRRGIESWGVGASLPPLTTVPVRVLWVFWTWRSLSDLALSANESRLPAQLRTWLFWASTSISCASRSIYRRGDGRPNIGAGDSFKQRKGKPVCFLACTTNITSWPFVTTVMKTVCRVRCISITTRAAQSERPLNLAASLNAVLQLSAKVTLSLKDIKHGSSDRTRLPEEG